MSETGKDLIKPVEKAFASLGEKDAQDLTSGEKGFAAAVHLVGIFAPLWGPLVAFFVAKGRSRYVEAHAWKALKEYFILTLAYFIYGAFSLTWLAIRLYQHWQENWVNFDWVPFLLRFAIGWVIFFILGIVLLILNIFQAYHAWQGKWPKAEAKKLSRGETP